MPSGLIGAAGGAGPPRRRCGKGRGPQGSAFGVWLMVGAGDVCAQQPEAAIRQPAMFGGFKMIERIPRGPGIE